MLPTLAVGPRTGSYDRMITQIVHNMHFMPHFIKVLIFGAKSYFVLQVMAEMMLGQQSMMRQMQALLQQQQLPTLSSPAAAASGGNGVSTSPDRALSPATTAPGLRTSRSRRSSSAAHHLRQSLDGGGGRGSGGPNASAQHLAAPTATQSPPRQQQSSASTSLRRRHGHHRFSNDVTADQLEVLNANNSSNPPAGDATLPPASSTTEPASPGGSGPSPLMQPLVNGVPNSRRSPQSQRRLGGDDDGDDGDDDLVAAAALGSDDPSSPPRRRGLADSRRPQQPPLTGAPAAASVLSSAPLPNPVPGGPLPLASDITASALMQPIALPSKSASAATNVSRQGVSGATMMLQHGSPAQAAFDHSSTASIGLSTPLTASRRLRNHQTPADYPRCEV